MNDSGKALVLRTLVGLTIAALPVTACKPTSREASVSTVESISPLSVQRRGVHWKAGANARQTLVSSVTAQLAYYGGRVVSNAQVVQVLYGSGSYLPQVSSTASPSVATFYQGVLNSPYVDWLTEYDTNTEPAPRTDQIIGRGAFIRQFAITPSAANGGPNITDANIQAELVAQIQAGVLPPPSQDAAGNNNSYYAVYFPHGTTIALDGSPSCVRFCAYHGTVASVPGLGEIYYGVHPDMQVGSGCENGCGAATTEFGNVTQVASHELIETITDPEVALATTLGPPLGWYDATDRGEIGDLCNNQNAMIVGDDGVTYDVQREYSNIASACIVSRPHAPLITAVPLSFEGGANVTGTVVLDAPASAGGVTVALTNDAPMLVTVPSGVTVPGGAVSATFPITSVRTPVKTIVTLTAVFSAASTSVGLTVLASPTVASVTTSPSTVQGGAPSTGTVTLSGPAPAGGAVVTLASADSAVTVPATTTVLEGATSATFTITTAARAVTATVSISASYHETTKAGTLVVTGIPAVVQIILTPWAIEGGNQMGGVVLLSSPAPAGGAIITMSSSDPTVLSFLTGMDLAPGADGGGFNLGTSAVSQPTLVTISATYPQGFTQTVPLLVMPAGNATFDPGLTVPRCASGGRFCDTGASLVLGRANIASGAEPNTPNTLWASCPDGTAGAFHSSESLDRLSITTVSGNPLATGEVVRVDASAWVVDSSDALEVFFAPDASNPAWTLMATVPPPNVFQQLTVLSAQFTLPTATLPAVRANFRRLGSTGPCTGGPFDDRDDLVFALTNGAPANHAPAVNAGPDQTVNLPAPANLSGTASDDGLPNPPGKLAVAWTQLAGPGPVGFGDPTALVTTANFSTPGAYSLRLTVGDGALTASDDMVVTVSPPNQPPLVNAGPDLKITLPSAANLSGAVTDDGLPNPPGTVTVTWTKASGPGTVTFGNAHASATTATFSASGSYVLQLAASDGLASTSDTIAVIVNPAPVNKAPVVNAGPDLKITLPSTATLNGTVKDDGLPNPPGAVTVTWSKVSGSGTVTFGNAHASATTATFSAAGTYVVRLTASDGALSSNDAAQVTVLPPPPCASLCSNPVNFTISGSFQSGPLGTGAVCYQTTSVMHGGNCGNFTSPRTLKVNGTIESCNGRNWASVPPARNGGYCVQTTAGNQPSAFFTAF